MELSTSILSTIAIYMKYAKFLPRQKRRESWEEIVTRNKKMHLKKYPDLKDEIKDAYKYVYDKKVLPSMRSMQFAGKPIEINPARLYNCSYVPMDHPTAFNEVMFLLLAGCGVGISVQQHHVEKLPEIIKPVKKKRYLIGDSIEGWSDAVKVLVKSYFGGNGDHHLPMFDFSDIRPKGARLKTSGGIAPGPEPLKDCLHNVQKILDRKESGEQLTSLEVHDCICHIADSVLAGGIRRSALLSVFSFDDEEMLTSKYGKWYELNPQRARANNSAVILRHKIEEEDFFELWEKIKNSGSGEPGFMFSNDQNLSANPCQEISLRPSQFCNLASINVSDIYDQEEFNKRTIAAATIATLQAGYTDFHYLRDIWQKTTEKEALIGVSLAGIASGGVLELNIKEAAKLVVQTNVEISKRIGIKRAARCNAIKPDGTTSLVLGSSSGIHAWHAPYYIRRIRVGKNEPIYQYLKDNHPELVVDEYFKPNEQAVIEVPQKAPDNAILRNESSIDLLNRIAKIYKEWIVPGHIRGHNKNNVSATVSVKEDEWEEVGDWMWNNKTKYTALSILPESEHSYIQEPFEEITKEKYEELMEHLKEVDLSSVIEEEDLTTLKESVACNADGCEVT